MPILSDDDVSILIEASINIVKKVRIHHSVAHSVLLLLARLTLTESVADNFYRVFSFIPDHANWMLRL